jgi:hypothetical protein
MVSLLGARIVGNLECDGGRFANPGKGALIAQSAEIGGDVFLRAAGDTRFEAEGCVWLVGARIAGDLELRRATLKHDGWALSLQTARIEGQLAAEDNEIEGAVDLSGARIRRLFDDPETAWGDRKSKSQIDLNEIDLDLIGAPDAARARGRLWRGRARWLRRNTGKFMDVQSPFSNQPWRQVAAAFERAGLHADARRIRRAELAEANNHAPFWRRPFVWLIGEQMFGFGLSVSRATLTALAFWALGAGGVMFMHERGALIAAQAPDKPALACAEAQPVLYALDVMIPVLDLGQERACEPGHAPNATLFPGLGERRLFEEIALWRWAKALYALFGAAIVGFAILTYTGVFKPRAEP